MRTRGYEVRYNQNEDMRAQHVCTMVLTHLLIISMLVHGRCTFAAPALLRCLPSHGACPARRLTSPHSLHISLSLPLARVLLIPHPHLAKALP